MTNGQCHPVNFFDYFLNWDVIRFFSDSFYFLNRICFGDIFLSLRWAIVFFTFIFRYEVMQNPIPELWGKYQTLNSFNKAAFNFCIWYPFLPCRNCNRSVWVIFELSIIRLHYFLLDSYMFWFGLRWFFFLLSYMASLFRWSCSALYCQWNIKPCDISLTFTQMVLKLKVNTLITIKVKHLSYSNYILLL